MEKLHVFNFHLTNTCNYRCAYCFGKFSTDAILTFDKIRLVIDNVKRYFDKNGILEGRINLAGGEPLLYSHLDTLIDYINAKGIRVSIVTNGSFLTKNRIQSWKGKVDCIGLSVDSQFDKTNREIGRCCGEKILTAESLIELANCIKENGIKLKVNTVVSRFNVNENLLSFYEKLQPDRLKILQMQVVEGVNDFVKKECIRIEEFHKFCEKHLNLDGEVVVEESGKMENSYLMIDPQGHFLLNDKGKYKRYGDCTTEELTNIISQVPINNQRFNYRYKNEASYKIEGEE